MKEQDETNLNTYAKEFRPSRNAAAITDARIRDTNAVDDNESDI